MRAKWESNSALLLILATLAILVGTIVTMVMPFAWVNTDEDRIDGVTPYDPLQLAGRDVYVREGCNNCHTQTVRPLVPDVVRYGPPSKSGEFVYDRPHLWGSRRVGPDLARVGGKYPDEWLKRHVEDSQALVPESNMPKYAFLNDRVVDPDLTRHKMEVLGFPFDEEQIAALDGASEMDALVAYLQKLGTDIGWREDLDLPPVPTLDNPYTVDDVAVLAEGDALYAEFCGSCHGFDYEGDLGASLPEMGLEAPDYFEMAWNGSPQNGMPSFSHVSSDKLWKICTVLESKVE